MLEEITGNVIQWIKEYLRGRKEKVTVREETSKYGSVASGVPQGSVFEPVLFLFYVNDIPNGTVIRILVCL